MDTTATRLLAFVIGMVMVSGVTLAQTTVPNTFTAGTAAKASEVNANFQALASAIDALGTGGSSPTALTGYGQSFGASAALADRNVILRKWTDGGGVTQYELWSYFQNDTVYVDGTTATSFAYIEEYLTISMDGGGNVVSISGSRYGGDADYSGASRSTYIDARSYDTSGTPTVSAATYGKMVWMQSGPVYEGQLTFRAEVYFYASTDTEPARLRDRSLVVQRYADGLTLNGIALSDVAVRMEPGLARRRLMAKGIGVIYRDDAYAAPFGQQRENVPTMFYARIDGTEYGASNLAGTPFDPSGGTLDGAFF